MENIEAYFSKIQLTYTSCESYYANIQEDITALKEYRNHLIEMSERGFKVQIALQRLENQINIKEISYDVLVNRKSDISGLFKKDLIELTKILVQYTPSIDTTPVDVNEVLNRINDLDESDESIASIDELKQIAVSRLSELREDVEKFTPEILTAEEKKNQNFDIGDLVNTLQIQKKLTVEKLEQYMNFYLTILEKHDSRATNYLEELQEEKEEITS